MAWGVNSGCAQDRAGHRVTVLERDEDEVGALTGAQGTPVGEPYCRRRATRDE